MLRSAPIPSARPPSAALPRGCRDSPRPRVPLPSRAHAQRLGDLAGYQQTPRGGAERAPFPDLSPAPLDVSPRCVRMLCLACGTAGRAMHSRGLCPKAERRRQFVTYEKLIEKDLDLYYPTVRDASDATPLGSTGAA